MPAVRAAVYHVRAHRGCAVLRHEEGRAPRGFRPAEAVHGPEEGDREARHLAGAAAGDRRRHRGGAAAVRPGRDPERRDRGDGHGPPARPGRGRVHQVRLGLPGVHGPPAGQTGDRTGPELAPHVGPLESVVLVPARAAGRAVWTLRLDHDPSASAGIPPHVTLMYPFLPPPHLSQPVIQELERLTSNVTPFDYALTKVREFEQGVVYLEPE